MYWRLPSPWERRRCSTTINEATGQPKLRNSDWRPTEPSAMECTQASWQPKAGGPCVRLLRAVHGTGPGHVHGGLSPWIQRNTRSHRALETKVQQNRIEVLCYARTKVTLPIRPFPVDLFLPGNVRRRYSCGEGRRSPAER